MPLSAVLTVGIARRLGEEKHVYAPIIDAVPEGASSGLGLMIGLGSAGFLAAICLLTPVPMSLIRETSVGQEESAVPQEA